jgi:hypothetical protein
VAELLPLAHNFAKQSRIRIFRNEGTRSTPLDPKLMFSSILDRFVTAQKSLQNWPNWCHYRTSSLSKVASEFFATNAPHPLRWTQSSCFRAFQTVSLVHESRCKKVAELAALVLNVVSKFFTTNAPDPLRWTQNPCFGAFQTVSLLHESRCKTGRTAAIIAQVR